MVLKPPKYQAEPNEKEVVEYIKTTTNQKLRKRRAEMSDVRVLVVKKERKSLLWLRDLLNKMNCCVVDMLMLADQ